MWITLWVTWKGPTNFGLEISHTAKWAARQLAPNVPNFPGWSDDPDECGPAPSCCYRSHQAWPLPVRSVINVTYGADSQPSYPLQGHLGMDKRAVSTTRFGSDP